MKMSFSKPGAPAQAIDVEATAEPAAAAPAAEIPSTPVNETTTVAIPGGEVNFDDTDIPLDQIRLPNLNIVHKVGGLADLFNAGELVLNGDLVLHVPANKTKNVAGDPPLRFVPIGFRKLRYTEKREGGERGDLVNTEEEVVAAGGTLDYNQWKRSQTTPNPLKRFEQLATALVLVEKPARVNDEDHQVFPIECDGVYYTLAVWNAKGTAYTNGAKDLFTARKIGFLMNPAKYSDYFWTFTTEMKPYGNNTVPIPVLKAASKTSEAIRSKLVDFGFRAPAKS